MPYSNPPRVLGQGYRMSTFEKVTLIITGVIAASAVITFLLIYFQLRETKNSAHLDQRAWVSTFGIGGNFPEADKEFHAPIKFKNSGKTFAKNVKVNWHIRTFRSKRHRILTKRPVLPVVKQLAA